MSPLISSLQLEEIVEYAIRTITETGIGTTCRKLQEKAGSNGLKTCNGRIFPDRQAILNTLDHIQAHRLPEGHSFGNHHSWFDNIVRKSGEKDLFIRVNDRACYFSDHKNNTFRPLTRQDVIEGTKLIHILNTKDAIKGYTCGTPQETHELLKGFEQYLIGYRHNALGGSTEIPSNSDLLDDYFDIREIAEDGFNRHLLDISVWSASPMLLESDELNLFFRQDTRINRVLVGSMPIMGLTGPVDPVGIYTLALAETLGGATILHALFPQTECYIMPHPQAMDLKTGLVSFGTTEHFRLEMIKAELFDYLEIPYSMVKDSLTSAQMPDLMAQSDKMLHIVSSITHGINAFSICPLGGDEGWSPLQCILDIEYIRNAWALHSRLTEDKRAEMAGRNINLAVKEKQLFGSMDDTLLYLYSNYSTTGLFTRAFGYQKWNEMGRPSSVQGLEEQIHQMIKDSDYSPPPSRWQEMMYLYKKICKRFYVVPFHFESYEIRKQNRY